MNREYRVMVNGDDTLYKVQRKWLLWWFDCRVAGRVAIFTSRSGALSFVKLRTMPIFKCSLICY